MPEDVSVRPRGRALASEVLVEVLNSIDFYSDGRVKVYLGSSIHKAMLEVSGFVGDRC